MNIDQLKDLARNNVDTLLERDNANKGYKCTNCSSGRGEKGTGITEMKDNKGFYTCWACGESGDLIHFKALEYGLDDDRDFIEVMSRIASELGVSLDMDNYNKRTERGSSNMTKAPNTDFNTTTNSINNEVDYTNFYKQCNTNLSQTNYMIDRGISKEVLDKYNVGYVENWHDPRPNSKAYMKKAIVLPLGLNSYTVRNVDPENSYRYSNVGNTEISNIDYIREVQEEPIFVVEGFIDMLSIEEVGAKAISTNSTSNMNALKDEIIREDKGNTFIVIPDNDDTGLREGKALLEALVEANIEAFMYKLPEEYKDPNDHLKADKEAFKSYIQEAKENPRAKVLEEYKTKYGTKAKVNSFIYRIQADSNRKPISTGFLHLDNALGDSQSMGLGDSHSMGGLYPEGLYVLGAISSLGKTTFMLQLADQIAEIAHEKDKPIDVLYYSLEMSTDELLSKSISRHSYIRAYNDYNGVTRYAKTMRGISDYSRYTHYEDEEKQLIGKSITDYSKYADNIYIKEGLGSIGTKEIREDVDRHIKITGHRPVVFIDYLQILKSSDVRMTEKQAVDENVLALKQMARDYQIPVFAISSFNRENYESEVNMTSFKESGAIEYSSDVLLGMQVYIDEDSLPESEAGSKRIRKRLTEEEKQKPERKTEIKILKNRNGETNKSLPYLYYTKYNYFKELNPKR